jgi:energy-coupling factor transporter ATP-binding protein EcfA2
MPRASSPFVYFTHLVIENVRSFADRQELVLSDEKGKPAQWTLIVGENGVGKTTLLQCIAQMKPLPATEPGDEGDADAPSRVEPALNRAEVNEDINALVRAGDEIQLRLEATLSSGTRLDGRGVHAGLIKIGMTIRRHRGDIHDFKAVQYEKKGFQEPLVLGYGAGRHMGLSNSDAVAKADPTRSLFSTAEELYDAEEILYKLDYDRLRKRKGAKRRLDGLKAALTTILPDIASPKDIEIHGPRSLGIGRGMTGVHVRTPYAKVPFSGLSLGYQTVAAWTVDIAWRLFDRYPDSANPLHEPAIVLVDEIDLHLHPHWQRQIRRDLTRYFPNVQFIATAHSPLMAQTYLDANLAVVRREGNHAVILNDPVVIRDWRLDQVITSELFGFDSARPPEIEMKLKRRMALFRKPRRTSAEDAELAALDREIDELPTAETSGDQEAMDVIRRAAKLLPHPAEC